MRKRALGRSWVVSLLALGLTGLAAPAGAVDAGWSHYGGDQAGRRYSSASEITPQNVGDLAVAWRYSTGELKRRGPALISNSSTETTPVLVEGNLVFCTPFNRVVALDPATGREKWVNDPQVDLGHPIPYHYNCRGVTPWKDPQAAADATCAVRIFTGTNDSRVVALDARTGRRCPGFGLNGEVRVPRETPAKFPGEIKISSAPLVAGGMVVVGSFIMDNLRVDAPRGTLNAFDARTGVLRWQWDPIPRNPSDPAAATWQGKSAQVTGAANVWSTMVADETRGLLYAPVGSASPDFWGGERKGANLYSSSVVALELATGKLRWHFQVVHHDIFDYEAASPPMLVDLPLPGGGTRPLVVQNTKMGFSWILDRETGKPIFGAVEKPVPTRAMPGEWVSPTQPFPVKPAPLVPTRVTPDDAWGFTFWDRAKCRELISSLRSEGIFTPASLKPGTILSPGNAGGMNWGGPAYDPARKWMIVNLNNVAQVVRLLPRSETGNIEGISLASGRDIAAQQGTPYGTNRDWLLSPWGAPCTPPPWGELVAVSLEDGSVKWRVPLGSIEDKLPIPFEWNLGTPNLGGPVVTAGGVVFIAATMDNVIRAFDVRNGKMLWRDKLPAGGQATPMTYTVNGRQFLVMVTGNHMWFGSPAGDEVVAYALPQKAR